MITERTLKRWRKESLVRLNHPIKVSENGEMINISTILEADLHDRILRLTQELLDQRLLARD